MGPPWEGQRGRTSCRNPSSKRRDCAHLFLSSWEISLAFWEVSDSMPWELEGTGVGELQTCLPASLSSLLTVAWLTCLALRPQLRLCAPAEPRHPAGCDSCTGIRMQWGWTGLAWWECSEGLDGGVCCECPRASEKAGCGGGEAVAT